MMHPPLLLLVLISCYGRAYGWAAMTEALTASGGSSASTTSSDSLSLGLSPKLSPELSPELTPSLSLWVPPGQAGPAALAANEWPQDEWAGLAVREAQEDDGALDEHEEAMSPSWLRGARASSNQRPKRAASPAPEPNEASSEDAAADSSSSSRRLAAQPAQQAKAARGHQFVTAARAEKEPAAVRELDKQAAVTTTTTAASSSRVGAARDASLGARLNEIPQGPRYSSVYESETQRHLAGHRYSQADSYGAYAGYGGYSGYGGSPSAAWPSASSSSSRVRSAPPSPGAPRRIIYYAALPDPAPGPHGPPGASRVPHEYRGPPGPAYDGNGAYAAPDSRYPPPGPPADNLYRYTIIDAEPPGLAHGGYRSQYRDRLPPRPPAPPGPSPAPAAYPHPYRLNPPAPAQPAPPSGAADAGPQAASPIQYTQYDYNGIGARTASSSALLDSKQGLGPAGSGPPALPLSDDPYRGFNPRQPAPWSMQVGTRLTVKDDGYGSSSGAGLPGLPPAARRFYVTSQQQPGASGAYGGYGQPPVPARFPRPLDRDRSTDHARSDIRNRLFR